MMAFGVLRYLEETNREDVLVSAYDALEQAEPFLQSGELQATIDQQAALQAYTGIEFAIRALEGEELPAETIVDVQLVTAETIE
jgi:ribose transport system substrate-binding protein